MAARPGDLRLERRDETGLRAAPDDKHGRASGNRTQVDDDVIIGKQRLLERVEMVERDRVVVSAGRSERRSARRAEARIG
jgi:hypothetical protein